MKKRICALLLAVGMMLGLLPLMVLADDFVSISNDHFPDERFRIYISEHFDTNKDQILSEEELAAVKTMEFHLGVQSLTGIEYFTQLEDLNCVDNELTELDVSKNPKLVTLRCSYNPNLMRLNVTRNPQLEILECTFTKLTQLDVTQNPLLQVLDCSQCDLTALDVTKNPALMELICWENDLTELDVTENPKLLTLKSNSNALKALDVSRNPLLTKLFCFGNQLTSLDVTKNTALQVLDCSLNELTDLDVSANPELSELHCWFNQLKELDVTGNTKLSILSCNSNALTQLDLSRCPLLTSEYLVVDSSVEVINEPIQPFGVAIDETNFPDAGFRTYVDEELDGDEDHILSDEEIRDVKKIRVEKRELNSLQGIEYFTELEQLDCTSNQLTELDVTQNHQLTYLDCSRNDLTELDVTENPQLKVLNCAQNKLTELDVTKNPQLKVLNCAQNKLTELDVMKNTALAELVCHDNALTRLDVTANPELADLSCAHNQLMTLNISSCPLLTADHILADQYTLLLDASECPSKPFMDAPAEDHWAHEGIDYCVAKGFMNGMSQTTFVPNGTVTRAQLVTILYRVEGNPAVSFKGTFTDVPGGQWYSDAIEWAAENMIVNGIGGGRFNPMGKITREQIAAILYRSSGSRIVHGNLSYFSDYRTTSEYAAGALLWATQEGIINGVKSSEDTLLSPKAYATRAQIAAMIMRLLMVQGKPWEKHMIDIGIAFPNIDFDRWREEGRALQAQLEAKGYKVRLAFAHNDDDRQNDQVLNMIENGARVVIISAINSEGLGPVLEEAKRYGCKVIAYDRLIYGSDAVSYYITFDNTQVGVLQGQYIADALDLDHAGSKTYHIEFVTGDPADKNVDCFLDGAMRVLQKYLDAGTLVCLSGQTEKAQIATRYWDSVNAQDRFERLLPTYYTDVPLDAVLASNDSTAQGVASAIETSYRNEVYPIITGLDCDVVSVLNLMDGKQAMSVFKDPRILTAQSAEMADAIMKGIEPPVNDTKTYDNGAMIVPSNLCMPVVCTADNYRELLIDSGYYLEEDLGRA